MKLYLFLIAFCTLVRGEVGDAVELRGLRFPEEKGRVFQMANGITALIQEYETPSQSTSLRVVWKQPSGEETVYLLHGTEENSKSIERFLSHCKNTMLGIQEELPESWFDPYQFHSFRQILSEELLGDPVVVIAVGALQPKDMEHLITDSFADVPATSLQQVGNPIHIRDIDPASMVSLQIDFTPPQSALAKPAEDLNAFWKHQILQELFQQRMERCARALKVDWEHPHSQFILPSKGSIRVVEEDSANVFSCLIWEIEQMKAIGFHQAEFQMVRDRILGKLQFLLANSESLGSEGLAAYYAEQFRHSRSFLDYKRFLADSKDALSRFTIEDLGEEVSHFLSDENRTIEIGYPAHQLAVADVENIIAEIKDFQLMDDDSPLRREEWEDAQPLIYMTKSSKHKSHQIAATTADLFYQLPLTEGEEKCIHSIITTMAHHNIFELMFKKKELEKKGDKIDRVHPLRFAGYILSTSKLHHCLKEIKKSSFKWDAFIDGFAKRMKEEAGRDNLQRFLPGFAQLVHGDLAVIQEHVNRKDWDGLIRSLL